LPNHTTSVYQNRRVWGAGTSESRHQKEQIVRFWRRFEEKVITWDTYFLNEHGIHTF